MKTSLLIAATSLCSLTRLADGAATEARSPWPTDRTPAPPVAAWQAVTQVGFGTIQGEKALSCEYRLIAEWLRVRCPQLKTAAITQLGGTRSDVRYAIEPPGVDRVPGAGELTFPVRPGERRVFMFWTLGPGYDGPLTVVPALVVQSHWLSGEEPRITVTDALHEPVATKTHPRVNH